VSVFYLALSQWRKEKRDGHREHASRISAWLDSSREDEEKSYARITNASKEPVYEIVVFLVYIQGAAPKTGEDWMRLEDTGYTTSSTFGVLLPGDWLGEVPRPEGGMNIQPGIEIAFTDHNNKHWIRRANGLLEEIPKSAIDYYNLARPLGYKILAPL